MTVQHEPWRVISGPKSWCDAATYGAACAPQSCCHCKCCHAAMQHGCMLCITGDKLSLQVMSIVGITAAALAPTVFAPAAGKRILPPEVSLLDRAVLQVCNVHGKHSHCIQQTICHRATSVLRVQGPDEQQLPGFEKKGAFPGDEASSSAPVLVRTNLCSGWIWDCNIHAGMWKEIERRRGD